MLVQGFSPNCFGPGMPQRIIISSRPSGPFAHDGRRVVREDPGQGRQVAGPVDQRPRELQDRLLALRDGVEVAHAVAAAPLSLRGEDRLP